MSSRDAILARIRNALAHDAPRAEPPVPEVWPRQNPTPSEMAERFARELADVHGETIRAATIEEARAKLLELLDEKGVRTLFPEQPEGGSAQSAPGALSVLGALDQPLCRELTEGLAPDRVRWVGADWTPQQIADLPAGLVAADYLLADTGTAMLTGGLPHERLMCYLPTACIVVARTSQLYEHLPALWPEVARRTADPATRGEFVFVTGPSRTADIEKILILGVHGPKRVIVLLVG